MLDQARMQRLEFGGAESPPNGTERRAIDDDPVARKDLRLPIQRSVVGVF